MLIAKKAVAPYILQYSNIAILFYLNNNHIIQKLGLGFYVPSNVVTNDDLSKLLTLMTSGSKKEQGFKKEDT
jgi:hypothetical protein